MANILLGVIFSVVVVLSLNTASSAAATTKHLTLDGRTNDDINPALATQDTNNDMVKRRSREIGSILLAVKNQIKTIILDIIRQACNSVRNFISGLMNKLLDKLQMFTFADALRAILNTFTVSTSDLGNDLFVETASEPVELRFDSWEEGDYRHPYYTSPFLNSE